MMKKWLTAAAAVYLTAHMANAMILPKNHLDREDDLNALSAVDEETFNKISDDTIALWTPYAEKQSAELVVSKRWNDSTVNAYAQQNGNKWLVTMFGGLARRPEITPDSFQLVICHELGHHFGGYPFYSGGNNWAANEGNADYFATQFCARKIWADQVAENKKARDNVNATVKAQCDKVWKTENEQNLCYRTAQGGLELATLLGKLGGGALPSHETPSTKRVSRTNDAHPEAQCRLDTYTAGAICAANFDPEVIPGKTLSNNNGKEAEEEANKYSCFTKSNFREGLRPRCWFAPLNESYLKWTKFHFTKNDD